MALTAEQKKARTRAQLELIVVAAMDARQAGNESAMQKAKSQLLAFNSPFEDLNRLAREAGAAVAVASMKEAVDDYARIAGSLMPMAAAFKDASNVAEANERDLLLPHLAAFTAQTAQTLTRLKLGIDGLREDLLNAGKADDLSDLADAAGDIVKRLSDIRRTVESLER